MKTLEEIKREHEEEINREYEELKKELDQAETMEDVARILGLEEVNQEGLDPEPQ